MHWHVAPLVLLELLLECQPPQAILCAASASHGSVTTLALDCNSDKLQLDGLPAVNFTLY